MNHFRPHINSFHSGGLKEAAQSISDNNIFKSNYHQYILLHLFLTYLSKPLVGVEWHDDAE
jgi:hypothetical protein